MRKLYIKEWRKARGLTQKQLAERMESEPGVPLISYVTVSNIERGEQSPTLEQLNAFAEALDVSVSMLIEYNPEVSGEIVAWIDLWNKASEEKHQTMFAVAKAAADLSEGQKTGTN